MSFTLPSKKIQALIIIVVGIFLAYLVSTLNAGSWFAKETIQPSTLALEAAVVSSVDADLDTDRDGLKDWQETLWGTDKSNADSDADGAKDGDEIESGRDPKIAGPEDSLEATRGISSESVTSFGASISADPNNISTSVSRDLFAKFMSLQSEGEITEEAQAELIADVISDIDPGSIPPRYSIADVRIADTSKDSLRSYGNQVAVVLDSLGKNVTPQSSNDAALATYEEAVVKLKDIQVPATLGLTHLQVLNNFNASYQMLILLAEYEKDPIKGLVALRSLQTNAAAGVELFKTIAIEFKNNDIIFSKTEAGYLWTNY